MKISKINSVSRCSCHEKGCGGYQKAKGHLDTQMFPECAGTRYDRDIVKKTRERRKRHHKTVSKSITEIKTAQSALRELFHIKTPMDKKLAAVKAAMEKLDEVMADLDKMQAESGDEMGNSAYVEMIKGAKNEIVSAKQIMQNHLEIIELMQEET